MLDECDEMLNMGFVDDVEKARPLLTFPGTVLSTVAYLTRVLCRMGDTVFPRSYANRDVLCVYECKIKAMQSGRSSSAVCKLLLPVNAWPAHSQPVLCCKSGM